MFDARIRPHIDPPLDAIGLRLAAAGIGANAITIIGFALGIGAAAAIAIGAPVLSAVLIALNRLADGLDGAVARATRKTDLGGYLDITLDFAFYGAIPLGFAILDPAGNALPATILLFSFYLNGAAFLAFAIMAEKRNLSTNSQGLKSLYYVSGLAEGTETITAFLLMALIPSWFPAIAWIFAGLCVLSASARVVMGALALRERG